MKSETNDSILNDDEDMIKDGGTVIENSKGSFYCLSIIGQIEGHYVLDNSQKTTKYDHVIPTLVALEESDKIDGNEGKYIFIKDCRSSRKSKSC